MIFWCYMVVTGLCPWSTFYAWETIVGKKWLKSILCATSPNLHHLFILTWSADITEWFVSMAYILRFSDHSWEGVIKFILLYLGILLHKTYTITVHLLIYRYHIMVCVLNLHFALEWPWFGKNGQVSVNITVPRCATFTKLAQESYWRGPNYRKEFAVFRYIL